MNDSSENTQQYQAFYAFPDRLPITLELFEGPIDLLLHLVKSNELPIEKLSLAKVANQYLEIVSNIQRIDFEVAGEYLVVAATLISIKAAVILKQPGPELPISEDTVLSPHDELLLRLKEAQIYREGAMCLRETPLLGIDVFHSLPSEVSVVRETRLKEHSPYLLGKALAKMIKKLGADARELVIAVDSSSIADTMVLIVDTLQNISSNLTFEQIVMKNIANAVGDNSKASRSKYIVATFLAILELSKRQVISISQSENFEEINLTLTGKELGTDIESELEQDFQEAQNSAVSKFN